MTQNPPNEIFTVPSVKIPGSDDNANGDLVVARGDIIHADNPSDTDVRYEVIEMLGSGQFGQVFTVVDISLRRAYAMKITKSDLRYRQQASREVQFLTHIRQNATPEEIMHISRLIDSFVFKGHICIVMELLSYNLYTVLEKRRFRGIPLQLVQLVAKEMLEVLVTLKKIGIVHCDIKPENILLADGFSTEVKMIDFGSSKFSNQMANYYVQSRYYRAPEVVLHIRQSFEMDVWSLGCVIFELFTALPLFAGQNEYHLMQLIVQFLGQFPANMVHDSPRRNEFFLPDGTLKSEAQICNAGKIQDKYEQEVLSLEERIQCENQKLCQLERNCAKKVEKHSLKMQKRK